MSSAWKSDLWKSSPLLASSNRGGPSPTVPQQKPPGLRYGLSFDYSSLARATAVASSSSLTQPSAVHKMNDSLPEIVGLDELVVHGSGTGSSRHHLHDFGFLSSKMGPTLAPSARNYSFRDRAHRLAASVDVDDYYEDDLEDSVEKRMRR